jgi:EAL domain-containing protein (putative c-di-GMP-specific phosphodiesterase class I)
MTTLQNFASTHDVLKFNSPVDDEERERLRALQAYDILDTPREDTFDEFARIAAAVVGAPMAFVNLVDADRVWSKAAVGASARVTERAGSFCNVAIQSTGVCVVVDAGADARFSRNAWVTGDPKICFYAGTALIDPDGRALGTLCVMDTVARELSFEQNDALRVLGRHVVAQLELRRRLATFKRTDRVRQETLAALKHAVRGGEFVVHYQPKMSLQRGTTVGLEALIRWDRPGHGLVSPHDFIPLLEESGLILEVGAWVLEQSADHYRDWTKKGLNAPRIAVNISPAQFRDSRFVDELERTTGGDDESLGGVDLEISESVLAGDSERVIEKLEAIRKLGFSVAVDNFGTGYSSWRYLARLPVDTLKIDRSFVSSMSSSGAGMSVVASMITLAHGLDFKVTAEGVETEAQRELLAGMGCDEIQGYLISRPLTKREIEHFLSGGQRDDAPEDPSI